MDLEDFYHQTVNSLARQLRRKDDQAKNAARLVEEVRHLKTEHSGLVASASETLDQCRKLDGETRALISAVQQLYARYVKAKYDADLVLVNNGIAGDERAVRDDDRSEQTVEEDKADEADDEGDTYFSADEEAATERTDEDTETVTLSSYENLTDYLNSRCGENPSVSSAVQSPVKATEVTNASNAAVGQENIEKRGLGDGDLNASFFACSPCKLLSEENASMKEQITDRDRELGELQDKLVSARVDLLASHELTGKQREFAERSFVRLTCKSKTKIKLLQRKVEAADGKNEAMRQKISKLEEKLSGLEELRRTNEDIAQKISQAREDAAKCRQRTETLSETLKCKQNENQILLGHLRELERRQRDRRDGKVGERLSHIVNKLSPSSTFPKRLNQSYGGLSSSPSTSKTLLRPQTPHTPSDMTKAESVSPHSSLSKNIWLQGILE